MTIVSLKIMDTYDIANLLNCKVPCYESSGASFLYDLRELAVVLSLSKDGAFDVEVMLSRVMPRTPNGVWSVFNSIGLWRYPSIQWVNGDLPTLAERVLYEFANDALMVLLSVAKD